MRRHDVHMQKVKARYEKEEKMREAAQLEFQKKEHKAKKVSVMVLS